MAVVDRRSKGVEFDLSTMHQGYFSVGNTPSRKAELSSRIDAILGADLLSVAEATSLRSRLLFADAQSLAVSPKQPCTRSDVWDWTLATCLL